MELSESSFQSGLPGPSTLDEDDSFRVQVLYLGEELRVVEVFAEDEEVRATGWVGWASGAPQAGCVRGVSQGCQWEAPPRWQKHWSLA